MDKHKILGQVNLATTTITQLYAVPSDNIGRAESRTRHVVVNSIVLCETAGSSATASVWIQQNVDVAGTSAKELLVSKIALSANQTHIIHAGIVLPSEPEIKSGGAGTSAGIVVRADTGTVTFQAFGTEVLR